MTAIESSYPSTSGALQLSDRGEYVSPTLDALASSHFVQEAGADPVLTASSQVSRARTVLIIGTLTGITFVGSMSTGLLTVSMPRIARDLNLAPNLLLWPASVYSLASGCCLILAGSIADFAGNRGINISGCFLLSIFTLAAGLSHTGIQLILFRAFQGVAVSMCLPTAFSILTETFPNGPRRNIGFSCLGLGQPFGFSVGLVMGGAIEDTSLGWRFGFYLCAGAMMALFAVSSWKLPRDKKTEPLLWRRLVTEIDWVGVLSSSSCLGISSYLFAAMTASLSNIRKTSNILLLCFAAALVPAFIFWMNRQERLGKPALIPNSLWKNSAFSTICVMVLLSWAVLNAMEYFLSLFFQEVQLLSPLEAALRFIPNVLIGMILNLSTGLLVHRIRADYLVLFTSFLCAGSPLLMAIIHPDWSWWYCAFWAVLLGPLSADVIFTVANLIITDVFSPTTQALAGAVFNTVAQFGNSLGIMTMAIISSTVTMHSGYAAKKSPQALMQGYRAVFWTCFGLMLSACCVGLLGLRKVGKVGLKRE